MNDVQDSLLAKAWIGEQYNRQEIEALKVIHDLRKTDPERCWSVILKIFEQAQSDDFVLGNLAAGPLEDLLADHGERFIERVETLARQAPRFRSLAQMVWRNSISGPVWARLRKAATLDP
jgi:hypothetical protein